MEQYLDMPVKRYSSGMYVRLAFAVAAHLEADILLVDEVLAVGDSSFQRKCAAKMQSLIRSGRAILLVSHNMTAIASLCNKGIMLSRGNMVSQGPIDTVIGDYISSSLDEQCKARQAGETILQKAKILSCLEDKSNVKGGFSLEIEFETVSPEDGLGMDLILRHNQTAFSFASMAYYSEVTLAKGYSRVACLLGPLNLAVGRYEIDVKICRPMESWIEEHDALLAFNVEHQSGSGRLFELSAHRGLGYMIAPQQWRKL
jgi:lipopolysaccharide transport system ATP-binding protein